MPKAGAMYWQRSHDEMSRTELEAARLGFLGYLRRKRFSPPFIERHADDLFGQACFEYSRKLKAGEEIENPPGWLIECAWRRTKSKLEAERNGPRQVSTDQIEPLGGGPDADPADLLVNADRWRKIRQAVGELSDEQRQLLAVSYFEGLPVREAARRLRWHPSKAQRAHERARERLHELLGVESSDDLVVEVGLAAYLSLAAEPSSGTIQKAAEGLASLRQQVIDGGATLKQQTAASYVRVAEATPSLAGMRPGASLAVLGTCAATFVGGVTYCAEKGVNPVGAARGVFASADEPEASVIPETAPPAPVYTPVQPEEERSLPEQPVPPAEGGSEPKPEPEPPRPPAPEESFEPVARAATEVESEPIESYEAAEPAPVESRGPAPVATSPSQEFEP